MDWKISFDAVDLRALRAFMAVVEHGGFGSAGTALGLSQSAISLRVKALEDALAVSLFDRGGRHVRLTGEGVRLAEHARAILDMMAAIPAAIGGEVAGRIAIGAVPTVMARLLPPALARLRRAHPGLVLTVQSGGSADLAQRLAAREIDLAILNEPDTPPDGTEIHRIAEEPLVVFAPPDAEGDTAAEILSNHPFIFFNRKSWAGREIERALSAHRLNVTARMEIDSLEAVVSMVAAGLGAAVAPLRAPVPEGVRIVPMGPPEAVRRVAALEPSGRPKARLTEALISALRDAAGDTASVN